jgi:hypothetical protein
MQLRKTTTQHWFVFDSVTVHFITLWKLSLHVLNVTCHFVMCIISYANVYFSFQWMAVTNGVTPQGDDTIASDCQRPL